MHASVADALDGVDVLIDYTSATAVKANTLAAIEAGVAVVIGSSGLTASDFEEIDAGAGERRWASSRRGTSRSPRPWARRRRCSRPATSHKGK